jgi:acetyl esterase/lipase
MKNRLVSAQPQLALAAAAIVVVAAALVAFSPAAGVEPIGPQMETTAEQASPPAEPVSAVPRPFAAMAGGILGQDGVTVTIERPRPEPVLPAVAYGPLPMQVLDVYRPTVPAVGTIVYFHSGGWGGNDRTKIASMILDQLDRGWAVVSVEYRLIHSAWAPEIVADADRSLRFVKANAAELGVPLAPIVAAGGSAGGHLAAMLAAAPGMHTDPQLPAELAAVPPTVDGLIDLVGPSDLNTLWQANEFVSVAQEGLLRCTLDESHISWRLPRCDKKTVDAFSPLALARQATKLPPAFLSYGEADTVVPVDTQGIPLYEAWSIAAGEQATWLDVPAATGHNLETMSHAALAAWLDQVALIRE